MKLLILIQCFLITHALKPNLCVNCKFFKKDVWTLPKYAKCALFPKVEEDTQFYVTGIPEKKPTEYSYCSTVRTYQCGKEGKLYQPK